MDQDNESKKKVDRSCGERVVNKKLEFGAKLYKGILDYFHNGNEEEMYNYLNSRVKRLDLYGENITDKLKFYCSFKTDMVYAAYNLSLKGMKEATHG